MSSAPQIVQTRGGDRRGLRYALVAVLVFDVFFLGWHNFFEPPENLQREYWPQFFVTLHDNTVVLALLSVLALVGLGAFALRKYPLAAALTALVSLGLVNEAYSAVVPSPRRMFFTSGAMLAGWIFGMLAAGLHNQRHGKPRDLDFEDRLGEAGALAGFAGTYFNAGIQKVANQSLFDPTSLRAIIYSHHHVGDTTILGRIAHFTAEHIWLSAILSVGAVAIQVSSVGLTSRRGGLRLAAGSLLLSFHLGTLILLDIIYVEATALLIAFAFPWHRLLGRTNEPTVDDPAFDLREMWPLVLAVVVLIGMSFAIRTPAAIAPGQADDQGWTVAVDAPEAKPRAGPFEPGMHLADWELGSLRVDGDSLVLSLLPLEGAGTDQGVRIGVVARRGELEADVFQTEVPIASYGGALEDVRFYLQEQTSAELEAWIEQFRTGTSSPW